MNIFQLILTVAVGFAVSSLLGLWLIPFLRRLHYGQTILEIGPSWHKKKQGTPTMGGIMFIVGSILAGTAGAAALLLGEKISATDKTGLWYMISGYAMAIGFAMVGFVDDYVKVVKKRNLGLKAAQKVVAQTIIIILYLLAQRQFDPSTMIWFPFFGSVDFGLFYYPALFLGIMFVVNAVNLTDGIDGLAGSVTFVVAMGFMVISAIFSVAEINLMAGALAGSCLGFLIWNFYPAKVFMGDTGSMYLGGMVVAMSLGLQMPVILLFVGIIYVAEALSVMLQVASFKLTGKRIFKMTPIHHSFEMSGWSEIKIVATFSGITLLGCVIAILAAIMK